jgi:hypothetical protein
MEVYLFWNNPLIRVILLIATLMMAAKILSKQLFLLAISETQNETEISKYS